MFIILAFRSDFKIKLIFRARHNFIKTREGIKIFSQSRSIS